jgi:hypothetical protein
VAPFRCRRCTYAGQEDVVTGSLGRESDDGLGLSVGFDHRRPAVVGHRLTEDFLGEGRHLSPAPSGTARSSNDDSS